VDKHSVTKLTNKEIDLLIYSEPIPFCRKVFSRESGCRRWTTCLGSLLRLSDETGGPTEKWTESSNATRCGMKHSKCY